MSIKFTYVDDIPAEPIRSYVKERVYQSNNNYLRYRLPCMIDNEVKRNLPGRMEVFLRNRSELNDLIRKSPDRIEEKASNSLRSIKETTDNSVRRLETKTDTAIGLLDTEIKKTFSRVTDDDVAQNAVFGAFMENTRRRLDRKFEDIVKEQTSVINEQKKEIELLRSTQSYHSFFNFAMLMGASALFFRSSRMNQ